jgi:hypothetical protein
MITIIIAIIVMYIIYRYNKNKLEHLELSTESVKNLTNVCTQEQIIYNVGNFNNLTANTINSENIFSSKNGTLDNITVANLDVSNNFTGKQGKFDVVRSRNLYGDVSANTGTFTTMNATNLNSDKLRITNANVNKLCFTPTNCITKDTINSMLLLDSPVFSYMYLPNTATQTYNFILPEFHSNKVTSADTPLYDMTTTYHKLNSAIATPPNDKFIILPTGTGMTFRWGTWGTTDRRIIRSDNSGNPSQSGDKPQDNGNGFKITIPPQSSKMTSDFTVLWVQVNNNINNSNDTGWSTFRVYDLIGTTTNVRKYYGKYIGGGNKLNNIDPNGAIQSDMWGSLEWIPVPIDLRGNVNRDIYISNFDSKNTYFSSFAFSTNPWNHAKSSALALRWQINNQDTSQGTGSITIDDTKIAWNNNVDTNNVQFNIQLARFKGNTAIEFRIPFVNSQRNKIFYISTWNNEYNPGIAGLEIFQNNTYQSIGNVYTTFDNPFSRHINSRTVSNQSLRYVGVVIPADKLPPVTENFMKLRITIAPGIDIVFSEVGTHDENPFD